MAKNSDPLTTRLRDPERPCVAICAEAADEIEALYQALIDSHTAFKDQDAIDRIEVSLDKAREWANRRLASSNIKI